MLFRSHFWKFLFNFDASDTFLVVNYKHSHQRGINRLVVMFSGNTFVWIYIIIFSKACGDICF